MIKAEGRKILSEILELINSIWNKEELPEEWKELIVATVCTKGDKTDCISIWGISHLSATYKILSNILLSRLNPYAKKTTGDDQCGF